MRHHASGHVQRQLHLRPVRQLAHGRSQRRDVPPVDQLRGGDDGEEIRHSVDQGELRGSGGTAKSLRHIAQYFNDEELMARVEQVISEEMTEVLETQFEVRQRCEGKTAMLFVGGSRAHHYQTLFAEMGMKTVAAGYEFGHRDDYEGRGVLPTVKVDADSRNIEELHVDADETRYRPRKGPGELVQLEAAGMERSEEHTSELQS